MSTATDWRCVNPTTSGAATKEGSERNRLPPTTEQPIGEYPTTYPREDANRGEQRDEQSAES